MDTFRDFDGHQGHDTGTSAALPSRGMSFDLQSIGEVLRRRSRFLAWFTLCGLLATAAALFAIKPRYSATASLILDPRQQRIFSSESALPGMDQDVTIVESQIEILRSPRIAGRVLKALEARNIVPFETSPAAAGASVSQAGPVVAAGKPVTASLARGDSGQQKTEALAPERMVELLQRSLTVERKGRSFVVDITFIDTDAQRAADVANAFLDAYLADQVDGKQHASRSANQWLRERLGELGDELEVGERQIQRFRSDNELVDVGEVSLAQKETADYASQLVLAQARAAETEAKLAQVRELAGDPDRLMSLDPALRSTVISDFRRQQAEIERKIGDAVSRFGEQHPTVIIAKAELEKLRAEIGREISRIVSNAQMTHEAAVAQVKLLQEGLSSIKRGALKRAEYQIRLNELKRDTEASANLYSALLRRYKETQAQEKLHTADGRVVSYAVAPAKPSHPKKTQILAGAALGWLLFGAGIVLTQGLRHLSFRRSADVERCLGMACIAELPPVSLAADATAAAGGRARQTVGPMCGSLRDTPTGRYGQAIFLAKRWTEALADGRPMVVVVTSANDGEGRSTVAMQLARQAALTGTRTLVVDGDLQTAGLTRAIAPPGVPTLRELASGQAEPAHVIIPTDEPRLSFCPAPVDDSLSPLTILGARAMEKFFRFVRDEFELIVVDSPASLEYVDAGVLIDHADAVIYVIQAGQTVHHDVSVGLGRLNLLGSRKVGVVLNKVAIEAA